MPVVSVGGQKHSIEGGKYQVQFGTGIDASSENTVGLSDIGVYHAEFQW